MTQATAIDATGQLTVLAGAEQGAIFSLAEDLTHIGSGSENQLVLNDPHLIESHCCVARRNGRFAIFAQPQTQILIDGQPLPAEQWVWLPAESVLQLSPQSVLYFSATGRSLASQGAALAAGVQPVAVPSGSRRKAAAKSEKAGGKRQTARFITDRAGETLVRLGEDGQLPELSLADANLPRRLAPRRQNAQGNPVLVYAALAFSILASVVLLVLEPAANGPGRSKGAARAAILSDFVGQPGRPSQPYQQLLREAALASSRGDARAEREALQRVLKTLNSEDRNPFVGVTGRLEDDERLRQLIAVLLAP